MIEMNTKPFDNSPHGVIRFRSDVDELTGEILELTATWEGGPIVAVTKEFLRSASPRWVRRDGSVLRICQYSLRIVREREDVVIAERTDGDI